MILAKNWVGREGKLTKFKRKASNTSVVVYIFYGDNVKRFVLREMEK